MGVARFSFADLCGQPLGAGDYLKIAHEFHTIILDHIPVLDYDRRNEAKRFIILIDTLYDHAVKLVASAAAQPDGLYRADEGYRGAGIQAHRVAADRNALAGLSRPAAWPAPDQRDRCGGDRRYLTRAARDPERAGSVMFFGCNRQAGGRNTSLVDASEWTCRMADSDPTFGTVADTADKALAPDNGAVPTGDAASARASRGRRVFAARSAARKSPARDIRPARRRAAEPDRQDQGRLSGPAGRRLYLQRGPRALPLTLCDAAARSGARRTHQAGKRRGAKSRRPRDAGRKHRSRMGRAPHARRTAVGPAGELRRQLDLHHYFLRHFARLDGVQRGRSSSRSASIPIRSSCSIWCCRASPPSRRRSS